MDWLWDIHWHDIFVPDLPVLEIILRGSVMYLALFFMLRFLTKRQAGSVGTTDILLIVLIADASQNGMAGDYKSVPDALILVGTLMFWSFALEWLGFHFPKIARLLEPPPLNLIDHGQMNRRNMQRELITKDELESQLREQGIDDLAKVKRACLEGDGKISVITFDS